MESPNKSEIELKLLELLPLWFNAYDWDDRNFLNRNKVLDLIRNKLTDKRRWRVYSRGRNQNRKDR